MKTTGKAGTAVTGGHLLRRTKQAETTAQPPVLSRPSDRVREQLFAATRHAAAKTVTHRAHSLADSPQERTRRLDEPGGAEDADEAGPEAGEAGEREPAAKGGGGTPCPNR